MTLIKSEIELAKELIKCPSVTPKEAGAISLLEKKLSNIGFKCHRLSFGEKNEKIENLFAKIGSGKPHFSFCGHVDVVPPGDKKLWSYDPFGATINEKTLYGRGATDMKSSIAAFIIAVEEFIKDNNLIGSISLIITGDEEGDAVNGTIKIMEWLKEQKQLPDCCLVGEPTSIEFIGDVIKNGRRGSLSCELNVYGTQGHVAYPHLANNPLPAMFEMLSIVNSKILDDGNESFDGSTAEITNIDVDNNSPNVIPKKIKANFNIRFNNNFSKEELQIYLEEHFTKIANKKKVKWDVHYKSNAKPYITKSSNFTEIIRKSIKNQTKCFPKLSTSGGVSDARFIFDTCPVIELGLVGKTMHKIDECVNINDITKLKDIYKDIIQNVDNNYEQ